MNNCTITTNKQYNCFELLFSEKPNEAMRNLLKSNGYKWHGQRKIWYGFKDISQYLNGAEFSPEIPNPQKVEQPTEKEEQKKLIGEYATIYGGNDKKSKVQNKYAEHGGFEKW